jgi:hypothetical protein
VIHRPSDPLRSLRALHEEIDGKTRELAARHRERLVCRRGCSNCCVDGIGVFEIEARRIRAQHAELLATGRPHPPGACAFLDDAGACRIYDDRPYVCRTQGLPLRWFDEDRDGVRREWRDICPLNERPDEPLESLPTDACWTIGEVESRLAALQRTADGTRRRIRLRDLFDSAG